jgi:hypothetical protein
MDGVQTQWLLAADEVDLVETTTFAIDAVLAAAVEGAALTDAKNLDAP